MLNIDSIKDKGKAMIYQDCLAQSCVSDTNQWQMLGEKNNEPG